MGQDSVVLARAQEKRPAPKPEKKWSPQEMRALKKLRREAKAAGATLASNGEGGLPPSLVLGVMRRDRYRCKVCGSKKMLGLHHKGHLENPTSEWLKKKGKSNDINNIVTICEDSHDEIHEEDRARGEKQGAPDNK